MSLSWIVYFEGEELVSFFLLLLQKHLAFASGLALFAKIIYSLTSLLDLHPVGFALSNSYYR